jgi:predicted DNA-binding transcriptional regulator AlpA
MSEIDDIRRLLHERADALCDEMEKMWAAVIERTNEPFIGKDDAAAFLNMSVTTLERRMAQRDGPPRYTDGGKVNFRRSELLTWRRQWRAGDRTGLER